MSISKITIGSDPEFFIQNKKGKVISSIGLIEGTKYNPTDMGDGYAVFKDNVLGEGNIPPTETREGFIANMRRLKEIMNEVLAEHDASIKSSDVEEFDTKDLNHVEANIFGCDAYNNAWSKRMLAAPSLEGKNYRTAGFHIHVGYTSTFEDIEDLHLNNLITKAFDAFVVLPSYLEYFDARRVGNYGGLGQYRNKFYGLECRSLGGFFTQDKYLPWVYDRVQQCLEACSKEAFLVKIDALAEPDIEDVNQSIKIMYKTLELDIEKLVFKTPKKQLKHAD